MGLAGVTEAVAMRVVLPGAGVGVTEAGATPQEEGTSAEEGGAEAGVMGTEAGVVLVAVVVNLAEGQEEACSAGSKGSLSSCLATMQHLADAVPTHNLADAST